MAPANESNLIQLHAGAAQATIDPSRGATMTRVRFTDGFERLWMPTPLPDPGQWPGGGLPVCFPFAGRVWHEGTVGRYKLPPFDTARMAVYDMPIHGFAALMPWKVVEREQDRVTLELKDTAETRLKYPFSFRLLLSYALTATRLRVEIHVEAMSQDDKTGLMPVAAGFHPYFRLPEPYKDFSDYELTGHDTEAFAVTPEGRAGARSSLVAPWTKPLSDTFLHNRILGGRSPTNSEYPTGKMSTTLSVRPRQTPGSSITPQSSLTNLTIMNDTPKTLRYKILWAKPDLGFFCVEPWMALPDAVHHGDGCAFMKPTQSLILGFSIF